MLLASLSAVERDPSSDLAPLRPHCILQVRSHFAPPLQIHPAAEVLLLRHLCWLEEAQKSSPFSPMAGICAATVENARQR